jgi:hypothetical protein
MPYAPTVAKARVRKGWIDRALARQLRSASRGRPNSEKAHGDYGTAGRPSASPTRGSLGTSHGDPAGASLRVAFAPLSDEVWLTRMAADTDGRNRGSATNCSANNSSSCRVCRNTSTIVANDSHMCERTLHPQVGFLRRRSIHCWDFTFLNDVLGLAQFLCSLSRSMKMSQRQLKVGSGSGCIQGYPALRFLAIFSSKAGSSNRALRIQSCL